MKPFNLRSYNNFHVQENVHVNFQDNAFNFENIANGMEGARELNGNEYLKYVDKRDMAGRIRLLGKRAEGRIRLLKKAEGRIRLLKKGGREGRVRILRK